MRATALLFVVCIIASAVSGCGEGSNWRKPAATAEKKAAAGAQVSEGAPESTTVVPRGPAEHGSKVGGLDFHRDRDKSFAPKSDASEGKPPSPPSALAEAVV